MNYNYDEIPNSTITRDTRELDRVTNNLYEAVAIISKRANQITLEVREELNNKLEEFAMDVDNLEEIFENREQIEISRFYEALPKPTLVAVDEFLKDQVYHRNPAKEESK
jgi:DNA-directed RNA polymerase subunit K/omega